MKKVMLGLAVISACLCACNSKTSFVECKSSQPVSESLSSSQSEEVKSSSSSSVIVEENGDSSKTPLKPIDWYSPFYYSYYEEPEYFDSKIDFDYQDYKSKEALSGYLDSYDKKNILNALKVSYGKKTNSEPGKFYELSGYHFNDKEYKRISMNFKFEIENIYFYYGFKSGNFEDRVDYLCVTYYNEVLLKKYYLSYTNKEISEDEVAAIEDSMGGWHHTGEHSGNFIPEKEYRSFDKFDVVRIFSLCTRVFVSYDENGNLKTVRFYENTPASGTTWAIVGAE